MKILAAVLVLTCVGGSLTLADESAKEDLNNAATNTSSAAKKGGHEVSQGAKSARSRAGTAGRDAGRKTKKSAHDVNQDIRNG